MTFRFDHETLGQRVCFASGSAREALAVEVESMGATRIMVIAGAAEADLATEVTGGLPVAVRHDEVVMHVPVAQRFITPAMSQTAPVASTGRRIALSACGMVPVARPP